MKSQIKKIIKYQESPALNQTRLKSLKQIRKIDVEDDIYYKERKSLNYGSAVDTITTIGEEYFPELFYVSDNAKPGNKLMSIVKMIHDEYGKFEDEYILKCCVDHEYYNNRDDDWKIDKVRKEGEEYFNLLKTIDDKIVLTEEEEKIVRTASESLMNHPHTKDYFEDFIPQYDIYFKHKGVDCKALLDMVIIDEDNKIVHPIDVKTISDRTENFVKSAIRFNYDFQAAWYTLACKKHFPDYDIANFKFLVESVKSMEHIGNPLCYTVEDDTIEKAMKGYDTIYEYYIGSVKHEIKNHNPGIDELVEKYKWHSERDQWKYEKEIIENNGHLKLKI